MNARRAAIALVPGADVTDLLGDLSAGGVAAEPRQRPDWGRKAADVWLATGPSAPPALAPGHAVTVAWAVGSEEDWARQPAILAQFDAVVAADRLARARLRAAVAADPVARAADRAAWLARGGRPAWLADLPVAGPRRRPVFFFPDFTRWNPYQEMLYRGLGTVGAYAVPESRLRRLLKERTDADGDPGVVHVHWTAPILQRIEGPFRAYQALQEVVALLEAFKSRGGRLVWTVHNVLPHDTRHVWAEVELGRQLAARADLVHVLSQATFDETAPHYRLDPAKVRIIEHSGYVGEYPDWIDRTAARARLDVASEATALIALGGIRPYKGLDRLLDVFERLRAADPSLVLLVAGRPAKGEDVAALVERCAATPGVRGCFEQVPDAEMQLWMRAADIAVLPYRRILNSGAVLLAQSFGLPVVAPRTGTLTELDGQPHASLFDPTDDDALESALLLALDRFTGPAAAAATSSARRFAEARPPAAMADRFARTVEPLLATS